MCKFRDFFPPAYVTSHVYALNFYSHTTAQSGKIFLQFFCSLSSFITQ